VIIETRGHRRRQGPAWIEQVSAKRRDVAADVAIAVSSSGFTEGAIALGLTEGVQMRAVRTCTPAYIAEHSYHHIPPADTYQTHEVVAIPMERRGQYSPLVLEKGGYICSADGSEPLTDGQLMTLFPDTIWQHATVEEDEVKLEFRMRNPRPEGFTFEVRSEEERVAVAELYIRFRMVFRQEAWTIDDAHEYSSPDGTSYVSFIAKNPTTGWSLPVVEQTAGPDNLTSELFLLRFRGGVALAAEVAETLWKPDPTGFVPGDRERRMIAMAAEMCRNATTSHFVLIVGDGPYPANRPRAAHECSVIWM